jgi:acyl-CoA synthetase (AMP-forming)/AMP-acid ligase II
VHPGDIEATTNEVDYSLDCPLADSDPRVFRPACRRVTMSTSEFSTLADVLARDRRSPDPALVHAPLGREYDYRRLLTTAWKAGLFLRNEGVREGREVAVVGAPAPEATLSALGAGLLGAIVTFDPDAIKEGTKALVAPTSQLDEFATGPETRRVGYGAEPTDPAVAYWERDVWSENPTLPPDRPGPEAPLLHHDGRVFTHSDLVDAAVDVSKRADLAPGDRVVLRAAPSAPAGFAAATLAPLLAGAVAVVPNDETVGDVAVGEGPEPRVVDLASVL